MLTVEPLRSTPAYIGPIMEDAATFPIAIFPVHLGQLNTPSPIQCSKDPSSEDLRFEARRHNISSPPSSSTFRTTRPYLAAPSIKPRYSVEILASVGGVGGNFPSSTPRCLWFLQSSKRHNHDGSNNDIFRSLSRCITDRRWAESAFSAAFGALDSTRAALSHKNVRMRGRDPRSLQPLLYIV